MIAAYEWGRHAVGGDLNGNPIPPKTIDDVRRRTIAAGSGVDRQLQPYWVGGERPLWGEGPGAGSRPTWSFQAVRKWVVERTSLSDYSGHAPPEGDGRLIRSVR